jgi:hypothetical protein
MALEAFNRSLVQDLRFNVLPYTQEITNRTDGPIVRKVEKVDLTMLEAEKARFNAAVDALVEKRGCSRGDAAIVLATVNPAYKRFLNADAG